MRFIKSLYGRVLIGVFLGICIGIVFPEWAVKCKPLGDAFISLLKMMIAPIIFCTIVLGIANTGSMKKVGRVGVKSLLYFESVSNIALLLGLIAVNLFKPGKGFNVDPSTLDPSAVASYTVKSQEMGIVDFILHIIQKHL
jgi:aerobic C4-dicarboxylate transport protein